MYAKIVPRQLIRNWKMTRAEKEKLIEKANNAANHVIAWVVAFGLWVYDKS